MQVWNVLHAPHWKYRTQKIAKNSPSAHYCTTLFGHIFATETHIDNKEKRVKQQYLPHMSSQYGELQPTSGWDQFISSGHPSKFQQRSRLGFVIAATLLNESQPKFAVCFVVFSAGTLYIQFGALVPLQNFGRCSIHFASKSCAVLYWQRYCAAL